MLVKLEAYHDGESWYARGLGVSIFTQGRTFDELLQNIREALALRFAEQLERGEAVKALVATEVAAGEGAGTAEQANQVVRPASDEAQRRKELAARIRKMRDESPALGMTTAELVHLTRREREWLYEG